MRDFIDNCTESNGTDARNMCQPLESLLITLLILLFIGFFTNLINLVVFMRMRKLTLRQYFVSLSISELAFCSINFFRKLVSVCGILNNSNHLVTYAAVSFLADISGYARNWIVLLIIASRCDAVLRPMSLRRPLEHHPYISMILMLIVAVICSALKTFTTRIVVCRHTDRYLTTNMLVSPTVGKAFDNLFFAFQAGMPVMGISVFTALILVLLIMRKQRLTGKREDRNSLGTGCQNNSAVKNQLKRTTSRATVMSVAVAVTVLVCESPVVVHTIMFRTVPESMFWDRIFAVLTQVCEILMVVDSLAKFVLFSLCNSKFRLVLRRTFGRHSRRRANRRMLTVGSRMVSTSAGATEMAPMY